MCRLVSIGGLTILFIKMGVWGRLARQGLTLLGVGYLKFPRTCFLCYKSSIINPSKRNLASAVEVELGGDRIPRDPSSDRFDLGADNPSECEVSQ
jgi:hypothetical protein